ncbi:MAG TPA: hypothetical protein PLJ13_04540, partial [Cyclobacteriaceae bacterium]|nr:hypothetical protein [Cyclobacteriaceae bacterium]
MKKSYLLLCFLILGFSLAQAQDFKRQYRQAKDHFDGARYSEAMDSFKPLTVYDQENPFPEYASFYYALSAQRLGYASVAKDMLLQ